MLRQLAAGQQVREQCPAVLLQILAAQEINTKKNNEPESGERFVSSARSKVKIMIIPTNEELMIARESKRVLTNE